MMVNGQQKQIKAISVGKNIDKKDYESNLRSQLAATPNIQNDNQLYSLAESNSGFKNQGRNQTSH